MDIEHIFVVGAGTMGHGIAQTAAVSGFQVTMTDVVPEALERGTSAIAKSVEKLASKGILEEEQKEAALSIETTVDMQAAKDADLVIEAATEDPDLKLQLFSNLDKIVPEGVGADELLDLLLQ